MSSQTSVSLLVPSLSSPSKRDVNIQIRRNQKIIERREQFRWGFRIYSGNVTPRNSGVCLRKYDDEAHLYIHRIYHVFLRGEREIDRTSGVNIKLEPGPAGSRSPRLLPIAQTRCGPSRSSTKRRRTKGHASSCMRARARKGNNRTNTSIYGDAPCLSVENVSPLAVGAETLLRPAPLRPTPAHPQLRIILRRSPGAGLVAATVVSTASSTVAAFP